MSCAIVLHGAIGSGKTCTCLRLVERARSEGVPVDGVITLRLFQEGKLIGYDCQSVASGEVFPLVRPREMVRSLDWFRFGDLKYAFSVQGFKRANEILVRSTQRPSRGSIIFIDEFGRLERAGMGLYEGARKVAEGLSVGGITVFACRTDTVDVVKSLVGGNAQSILKFEPGDAEPLWLTIKKCLNR
jgi:nucleoside-triphosphatase THEP1